MAEFQSTGNQRKNLKTSGKERKWSHPRVRDTASVETLVALETWLEGVSNCGQLGCLSDMRVEGTCFSLSVSGKPASPIPFLWKLVADGLHSEEGMT